jgi:4-hydroxy-tetrahydrodipicolinate synthase
MSTDHSSIRGVITVLNTPFSLDGSVDLAGLHSNISYALDANVAGFLVNGLAAEIDCLSIAEREAIVSLVVDTAGSTLVIGGLGSATSPTAVRTAARYLEQGCRGLLVNGAGIPADTLLEALLEIDRLHPPFIMLQDWDPTGAGIPVKTLYHLLDKVASLSWIKVEVNPCGPKYSELLSVAPTKLRVSGGWAVMQMIEALDRGVHAIMPTALHRTYARIYHLHSAGRRDESRALFNRLLPILAFSNQRLEISVAFFKRLLYAQGLFESDYCRLPDTDFDLYEETIADELIEFAIELESLDFPSS